MGARQPCRAQRVRFIRVNNVHAASGARPGVLFAQQPANVERGGNAPASRRNAVNRNSRIVRAIRQLAIAHRNQFRGMSARVQALQQQQRLVLSPAVILSEIDNQRAHSYTLPGLGQERRVSFSPASRRPSLRYLW